MNTGSAPLKDVIARVELQLAKSDREVIEVNRTDLAYAVRVIEGAKQLGEIVSNVLLVSSKQTQRQLDGEKVEYVESSLQEFEQLQDALARWREVTEGK